MVPSSGGWTIHDRVIVVCLKFVEEFCGLNFAAYIYDGKLLVVLLVEDAPLCSMIIRCKPWCGDARGEFSTNLLEMPKILGGDLKSTHKGTHV
ncbi:hypothetical protein L195_g057449 [Trifolium pratense]|uniref:Uncharacterized protein n=1 Tax=Trifolium pratense TaxID=57577 RepID=A0A2K3KW64_TRIPR|nr:hypothetical protein L195_g057449 [Trifolium pratense]